MATESTRTSKITLYASFGVLALAIIAALVIFLLPSTDPTPTLSPTASPAPGTNSPDPGAAGSGCKAPPSDNRKVPSDLRWAASQGITWPVSDSTGPTTTTEGFPACFEHSPVGASLAAVSFLFAQVDHSPLDTANFYLAESPGRDAALAELNDDSVSQLKKQIETNGISVVGFKVDEYDGNRAVIRIVLRVPGSVTGFSGYPAPMVWVDGDWKVKLLDNGSTGQASDETDGDFTYWTVASNG
ncbi:hypothetical protein QMG83_15320 [Salinibacterium sp. G-O1]|uniref:hypothetical protein n=1 Tax=Salinibacterium sp. G-O1 TaxID=3046208 RepID=UPI0024BBC91F|nr:hypothetical protein [Salinibacterium sp. G-O1]MDJ0336598.1 hypothetical protein [Salinibacterium sp. G-O1]